MSYHSIAFAHLDNPFTGSNYCVKAVFDKLALREPENYHALSRLEVQTAVAMINNAVGKHHNGEELEPHESLLLNKILDHYSIQKSADGLLDHIHGELKDGNTDLDKILLKLKDRFGDCEDCKASLAELLYDNTTHNPNPVNKDSNLDDVQPNVFQDDEELDKRNPMKAIRGQPKKQKVPSVNPKLPNPDFQYDRLFGPGEQEEEDDTNETLIFKNKVIRTKIPPSLLEKVQRDMERKFDQNTEVEIFTYEEDEDDRDVSPDKIQDRESEAVPVKIGHTRDNLTDEQQSPNDTQSPARIPGGVDQDRSLNTDDEQYTGKPNLKDKEVAMLRDKVRKLESIASEAIANNKVTLELATEATNQVIKDKTFSNEVRKNKTIVELLRKYGK